MFNELKFSNCTHSRDPVVSCALEGVAGVIAGIKDVCLLIHSPQGCSSTVAAAYDHHEIDFSRRKVACSRLFEMDIILGATEKLKDLIRQADNTFRTKVIFVVGTCAADIIGEDIEGLCKSVQPDIKAKLIPVIAGGFRGSSYDGTEIGFEALFEYIEPAAKTEARTVNLIAPQSSLNPTWWADLNWIREVLETMNVKVKAIFSHNTSLEDIAAASEAEANILLSHNNGFKLAKKMEDKFGIPLILDSIPMPIGCSNTARWLTALGDCFESQDIVKEIITKGEEHVVDILRRRGLMIIPRYRNCRIAVSTDATFATGLARMLFEELEMIPELFLIRPDNEHARIILDNELKALNLKPGVVFGADGYAISKAVSGIQPDSIAGSAWEHYIARELGVKISFDLFSPVNRDIYLDKPYFGYDGMLNMLEIMGNDWERQFRSREIKWEQYKTKVT